MHCFKFHNKMRAVLPRERRKAVLKTFGKERFWAWLRRQYTQKACPLTQTATQNEHKS